jgi:hypothetical protein
MMHDLISWKLQQINSWFLFLIPPNTLHVLSEEAADLHADVSDYFPPLQAVLPCKESLDRDE